MIIELHGQQFFKSAMADTSARDIISADIDRNFEGNFQKITKSMSNEEFLQKYDAIISQFMTEANLTGTVTKNLFWVNHMKQYFSIPPHKFNVDYDGQTFILKHYVRWSPSNPKIHHIINDTTFSIDDINQNDVLIYNKDVESGVETNSAEDHLVILSLTFTIGS